MTLRPMSDSEIQALMERIDSDDLRAAYSEMLEGCRRDPENRIWYAPWEMVLTESQESVGGLGFKGPVRNHSVEIGYGVCQIDVVYPLFFAAYCHSCDRFKLSML